MTDPVALTASEYLWECWIWSVISAAPDLHQQTSSEHVAQG